MQAKIRNEVTGAYVLVSRCLGLLCVRDTCPSRLCRHRPLKQTVDLNTNNYIKTTLGEKPDDKTTA